MQYASQRQPKPQGPGVGDGSQPDAPQGKYRDVLWALLFIANVVLVCVAAAVNYKNIQFKTSDSSSNSSRNSQDHSKGIIGAMVVSFASSIAFSNLWIRYLCRPNVAGSIIKTAVIVNIAFAILGVIVAFASGQVVGGILTLVFCLITLAWYYFVRHRIAFTSVMLEMAANCTREFGSTVYIAIMTQFVSLLWATVWVIAILGTFGEKGANSFVAFLLVLSLYWTVNVLFNVVHVSVGGVAASWFYRSQTEKVVSSSVRRACTTSFGSICLGSFIVSVIEALRSAARSANRDNGAVVACIVDCILGLIQAIAEFISKYAYAYVAIWGQDFCTAAKNTWGLLKTRGFDVIVNDDLSNLAFALSAVIGGIVGGLIGGLVCLAIVGWNEGIIAGLIIGFVLGGFFTGVAMTVLDSCVTVFFVLWAEDPSPLATNHPSLHQKLVAAVRKMYPNIQGPL